MALLLWFRFKVYLDWLFLFSPKYIFTKFTTTHFRPSDLIRKWSYFDLRLLLTGNRTSIFSICFIGTSHCDNASKSMLKHIINLFEMFLVIYIWGLYMRMIEFSKLKKIKLLSTS